MRRFAASELLLVAVSAMGCSPLATKGTMPPPGPNGQLEVSLAPDFIAVAGRDGGIAGDVPKAYLFPEPTSTVGRPDLPPYPVYAEDLRTLVGHMVAGKGFVPLGVDSAAIPNIPVQHPQTRAMSSAEVRPAGPRSSRRSRGRSIAGSSRIARPWTTGCASTTAWTPIRLKARARRLVVPRPG